MRCNFYCTLLSPSDFLRLPQTSSNSLGTFPESPFAPFFFCEKISQLLERGRTILGIESRIELPSILLPLRDREKERKEQEGRKRKKKKTMSGTILSSLEASSAKKRNEIITPTLSSNFSVTSNQDQNLSRQNGMKKNEGKYQKFQKMNPKENPVLIGGLSMVREESISPNSTIHNTTNCRMSKIKMSSSNLSSSNFPTSNVSREKSVEEEEEEEDPVIARMRKIPCLGIIMAFISGIFFATAGFTVCLIPNIDATLIVVFR